MSSDLNKCKISFRLYSGLNDHQRKMWSSEWEIFKKKKKRRLTLACVCKGFKWIENCQILFLNHIELPYTLLYKLFSMWIKDIHGWTDFMDSNRHTCKYLTSWSTNKSPLSPNALQEWLKIKLHFVLSKVYPALVINSHYSFPLRQNCFEPFACVKKQEPVFQFPGYCAEAKTSLKPNFISSHT